MNRSKLMVMLAINSKAESNEIKEEKQSKFLDEHDYCNNSKCLSGKENKDVYDFQEELEENYLDTSAVSIISPSVNYTDSVLHGFSSSDSDYVPSVGASSDNSSKTTTSSANEINKLPLLRQTPEIDIEAPVEKVKRYLETLQVHPMTVSNCDTNLSDTNEESSSNQISGILERDVVHATVDLGQYYTRKPCARERPTICPFCYQDVITHFPRHLFRHHQDKREVRIIKSLKARSKERTDLIKALRKQGYFHLKVEKNVLHPVKTSKKPNAEYFVCTYCLGYYCKQLLYKHVKVCKEKPEGEVNAGKKCLTRSQTFMASVASKNHEFLKKSRIKTEIFDIMRADQISGVAKSDPLICLYGEALLNKHKRKQIGTVISNKIRELARLLLILKKTDTKINGLFDCLKPEMFQSITTATRIMSGYDARTKDFRAPSLALHMGTNLKLVCDIALKLVIENRHLPGIKWNDRIETKSSIKDLKRLIEGHWCNELSSLALKTLTERKWLKPTELPLASDIQKFNSYVNEVAKDAYQKLSNNIYVTRNYKILTECVLTQTILFNRKRVGDVQYLKINTYNTNFGTTNQEAFMASLSPVERLLSQQFKRVVEGGKGSKPVPILFSKLSQKYIACMLKYRNNFYIVPQSNPYIFANPGSENRWMSGGNVIRKMAKNCGLNNPTLITSTKFRKHIATTLQLLNMDDTEMEQVATFLGHTKKTHAEFYRIPQDIYQTAKMAKVLLLLEKGKAKELKGKNMKLNLRK